MTLSRKVVVFPPVSAMSIWTGSKTAVWWTVRPSWTPILLDKSIIHVDAPSTTSGSIRSRNVLEIVRESSTLWLEPIPHSSHVLASKTFYGIRPIPAVKCSAGRSLTRKTTRWQRWTNVTAGRVLTGTLRIFPARWTVRRSGMQVVALTIPTVAVTTICPSTTKPSHASLQLLPDCSAVRSVSSDSQSASPSVLPIIFSVYYLGRSPQVLLGLFDGKQ